MLRSEVKRTMRNIAFSKGRTKKQFKVLPRTNYQHANLKPEISNSHSPFVRGLKRSKAAALKKVRIQRDIRNCIKDCLAWTEIKDINLAFRYK